MHNNANTDMYRNATTAYPVNADTTMARGLMPRPAAAKWLGLKDTRVVDRLVREGRLKAVKIGNRHFVTTKSLRRFVGA